MSLSALEEDILTILQTKSAYGFQIIQVISGLGDRQLAQGTVYPILKKLMERNLTTAEWGGSGSGARQKIYQITRDGEVALKTVREYREALSKWDTLEKA